MSFEGADLRQIVGPPEASEKFPRGMKPGGTKPPGDGEQHVPDSGQERTLPDQWEAGGC